MRLQSYLNEARDLYSRLKRLTPRFVKAAQRVYNEWDQSDPDNDMLAGGGICQDIAGAICDVLYKNRIDCTTYSAEIGEQHVWAIAYDEKTEEAYNVDISPYTYERGGGYTWKK